MPGANAADPHYRVSIMSNCSIWSAGSNRSISLKISVPCDDSARSWWPRTSAYLVLGLVELVREEVEEDMRSRVRIRGRTKSMSRRMRTFSISTCRVSALL